MLIDDLCKMADKSCKQIAEDQSKWRTFEEADDDTYKPKYSSSNDHYQASGLDLMNNFTLRLLQTIKLTTQVFGVYGT